MYPCKPDFWQRLNSRHIPGINTAITPIYSCIAFCIIIITKRLLKIVQPSELLRLSGWHSEGCASAARGAFGRAVSQGCLWHGVAVAAKEPSQCRLRGTPCARCFCMDRCTNCSGSPFLAPCFCPGSFYCWFLSYRSATWLLMGTWGITQVGAEAGNMHPSAPPDPCFPLK